MQLPLPQRAEAALVFHDLVEVQPQEDGHPRLGELVVPAADEAPREGADEVEELVGLARAAVAEGEGSEL